MMNDYVKIFICCQICIIIIVLYGTYRCKNTTFVDPLTQSLFPYPLNQYLDGWGISHFTFFALLAFFFPQTRYLVFLFILGLIWEILEYVSKDRPLYLSKCSYKVTTDNGQGWWYGRWQDIIMNTLGIIIGAFLARQYKK